MDLRRIENEYPFRPKTIEAQGGARLSFLDEGEGPCVLALHGNPTWSFYYRKLVLALRDGARWVVPDHIGCGLSDKPQNYDYTLERRIDDVERLVEALDLRDITLVVHDWGGAIGFGLALRRPERFKRFVVFNTSAFLSPDMPRRIALGRIPLFGAVAIRGFNAFACAAVRMATAKPERMTPEVRAGYLGPYDNWRNRIALHRFVRDIPMSPKDRSYGLMKSIDDGVARFKDHPMMVCWGTQDFCFNDSFLALWRERFPGAEFHELADAGHYVVEDAHERIAPLIRDFMARG